MNAINEVVLIERKKEMKYNALTTNAVHEPSERTIVGLELGKKKFIWVLKFLVKFMSGIEEKINFKYGHLHLFFRAAWL